MGKEVVETIYGKHKKYEIIRETGTFSNPKYVVKDSDGKYSGEFSSLSDAVEWAENKG